MEPLYNIIQIYLVIVLSAPNVKMSIRLLNYRQLEPKEQT